MAQRRHTIRPVPELDVSKCNCPTCNGEEWDDDFVKGQCLVEKKIKKMNRWFQETRKELNKNKYGRKILLQMAIDKERALAHKAQKEEIDNQQNIDPEILNDMFQLDMECEIHNPEKSN